MGNKSSLLHTDAKSDVDEFGKMVDEDERFDVGNHGTRDDPYRIYVTKIFFNFIFVLRS